MSPKPLEFCSDFGDVCYATFMNWRPTLHISCLPELRVPSNSGLGKLRIGTENADKQREHIWQIRKDIVENGKRDLQMQGIKGETTLSRKDILNLLVESNANAIPAGEV
ncbi:hypothetical protein EKO27_g10187 [Xylaria grammica]|uniref:Uncharacterized protein n=1 Tax=Xylaria grammica TaxID=363999 RepID=A0A439CRV1_9PEZI|nr:hypothetical protein EKO27_g10187 [Xylaria grammica]